MRVTGVFSTGVSFFFVVFMCLLYVVHHRCDLNKAMKDGSLALPNPAALPNSEVISPFFFVGDAAFPLMSSLMKPLPGTELANEKRIYNYRYLFILPWRSSNLVAVAFQNLSWPARDRKHVRDLECNLESTAEAY